MTGRVRASAPGGRILYVGNLMAGGNGPDRAAILEESGYVVEGFDTLPYRNAGPRLVRSMTARWQTSLPVWRLNRDLKERAAKGGFDLVFVDKGTILYRSTVVALRKAAARNLAIHYTPDAQFFSNRSRHFFRAVPDYDLLVTTKPFEIDAYRQAGARELLHIEQGFGPRMDPALAVDVPQHLQSEVAFVGHCQPHYTQVLEAIAAAGPLAVWGPGWQRYARRNAWAREVVRGDGLFGPDYVRALAGAKIAIGLLSKFIPETTTTRSFEIPAIGTMLLAERTDDHRAMFEEGVEAEFFDGPAELVDKIRYYLTRDAERERIAKAGQEKCRRAGYSTDQQFARIVAWLEARTPNGQ
ncbi:CgeB family protein [Citreimonas salinaria]|uniref:Glycosyl transferases group 1 n=1 Tax=Citreimonas salinaria TaxID=321339 RepID=A0A1H3EZQ6_9RHOB|nr:glycosyltransferase [Citreimonas salinaria]SDX84085.1 Glycosyl transferases group 1 [Citreimonas salinaria]